MKALQRRQWQNYLLANPAGGGGGGGGVNSFIANVFNADTSTVGEIDIQASVTQGNTVFAVCVSRNTGTQTMTGCFPTRTGYTPADATDLFVSDRFDTGGTSDGAYGAAYYPLTVKGSALTIQRESGTGGAGAVGLELTGSWTVSAALATGAQQAVDSDPTVASVTGGDGYDALLVVGGWGDDSTSVDEDYTANVTPTWTGAEGGVNYTLHHNTTTYRADAFIGLAPPSTDGITLALTSKAFSSSGWKMRVYGLTQA